MAIIWPDDPDWLAARGYAHQVFDGEMRVSFASAEEATELARIFYPDSAETIEAEGMSDVPSRLLGTPGPRDLSWKRRPA